MGKAEKSAYRRADKRIFFCGGISGIKKSKRRKLTVFVFFYAAFATSFAYTIIYNVIKAGENMVVYADILIIVNFTVDYFLVAIAARFLHKKPRLIRQLLSAFAGGVFSLYIFLPQLHFVLQTAIQLIMCAAVAAIAFGFEDIKSFFRNAAVLYVANFAYSGAMIAIWLVLKPYGMVINNSVVYFNISPLFLIVFSVVGYFIVALLRRLLKKDFSQNNICDVKVICGQNSLYLSGIVDTGNNLTDAFGMSEIFITEEAVAIAVLGEQKQNNTRYRAIPCSTVAGQKLLDGYRIDSIELEFEKRKYCFKNPILAVSATPLGECKIIINPENLT